MKNSFSQKVLLCLQFIPDGLMLKLLYFYKFHRFLPLKNPVRYTEWLQWYKAKYRNPEMLRCTDKYKVREYVKERIGDERYLNTLYQVCDSVNDINFKDLPNQFVIKTTDGGNGDNVYICKDKQSLDVEMVKGLVNSWRHKHYEHLGREWAYNGATDSRIIIERYLEDPSNSDGSIDDYKFLCFNGKFRYLWIDKGRYSNHRRGFWDENLKFLDNVYSDWPTFDEPPVLPYNIGEMIEVAEKLAKGFIFARIDFYNINGKITFGEITFYPWGGYVKYTPDSFDYELGSFFTKEYVEQND